jgi:hypothetical protein
MSDTYNYADGAVHHDHHRSITINGASGRELQALLKAFLSDEAEEGAEVKASPQPSPEGEGAAGIAVPEVLLTDKARELHARLREAGMVDEGWQPVGLSNAERGMLVFQLAVRLDIQNLWQVFASLWGTTPGALRSAYNKANEQRKTLSFIEKLKNVLN